MTMRMSPAISPPRRRSAGSRGRAVRVPGRRRPAGPWNRPGRANRRLSRVGPATRPAPPKPRCHPVCMPSGACLGPGPFRHDHGHHDVDEQRDPAGQEDQDDPDHADDRRVDIERLGDPPATPASIRSSRERYSRSATAILRIQRERAGIGFGPQVDLDRPRSRSPASSRSTRPGPGRGPRSRSSATKLSPVCNRRAAPAGAHSRTAPALASIDPVIDRFGSVSPSDPALSPIWMSSIWRTVARSTVAEPALSSSANRAERRAVEVDRRLPALVLDSDVEPRSLPGRVTRHVSGRPRTLNGPPSLSRERTRQRDRRAGRPPARHRRRPDPRPATRCPQPIVDAHFAAVELESIGCRAGRERALLGREPARPRRPACPERERRRPRRSAGRRP